MNMMKRNKNENKTESKAIKYILTVCMLSLMIMLMVIVGSMLYFHVKIKHKIDPSGGPEYQDYDAYYVVITDDNGVFWKSVLQGARESARDNNAYVELLSQQFSEKYNKYELMQIAIYSKVDGIILQAGEDPKMTQLIQRAEQENIPVVTVLEDNTNGGRQSFIGISSHNLGQEYGGQIADIIDSKKSQLGVERKPDGTYGLLDETNKVRTLVLLDGDVTDNSQNTVLTAINETLEKKKLGEVVSVETQLIYADSAFSPEEAIRDIFILEEKQPDIIVCLNEQNTICAYQAVVDLNRVGQTEILGYYESEMIRSAIEKKIIWSSVSVDTRQMGALCVDALAEYLESGYVSDYYAVDISLLDVGPSADGQIGVGDEESD